jgi:hypothetical protein
MVLVLTFLKKFKKPPNPVQKLGLVPYVFGACIDIKFYNKFSIGAKFYN